MQPPDVTRKQHAILWATVIVVSCLLVYHRVFGFDFVEYDDQIHVFANPYLNPPTWASVAHFWRVPYQKLYIPVAYTVYGALAAVAHVKSQISTVHDGTLLNPHVFHAANIALHCLNSLLVFWLLRRIVKRDMPAALGALLFAVHPFQVEAVCWISELRGLLSASLSLGCVCLYVAGRTKNDDGMLTGSVRTAYYVGALLLFIASILSKPSAVVTPLLALLVDYLVEPRPWRAYAAQLSPWLVASGALVLITRTAQVVSPGATGPVYMRPLIATDALAFYTVRLAGLLPVGFDYGRAPQDVLASHIEFVTWIVPALAALGCYLTRKRYPWLSISALIALVALLPTLGLVPFVFQTISTVTDRYAYLALLGPAVGVAAMAVRSKRWGIIALAAWLVVLAGVSMKRTNAWQNTATLWASELRIHPYSVLGHFGTGVVLMEHENYLAAVNEYEIALKARPSYADAHFNLGCALESEGKWDEADAELRTAIAEEPDDASAYMHLGNVEQERGDVAGSFAFYDQAEHIDPRLWRLNYNRGNAYMALGRTEDAVAAFQREMKLEPDYAASYVNAGIALAGANQFADAADMMTKAIAIGPAKASWYSNLAYIEARLGSKEIAIEDAQKAQALDPSDQAAAFILKALR